MKAAAIIPARWASSRFPGQTAVPDPRKASDPACLGALPDGEHAFPDHHRNGRHAHRRSGVRFRRRSLAHVSQASKRHRPGRRGRCQITPVCAHHQCSGRRTRPPTGLIDRLGPNALRRSKLKMVTAASPFDRVRRPQSQQRESRHGSGWQGTLFLAQSHPVRPRRVTSFGPGSQPLWHIGIYGYRRDFLLQFVRWRPTRSNAPKSSSNFALSSTAPPFMSFEPPSCPWRGHPGRRPPRGSCPG